MTQSGLPAPGWYYAQSDPPGTQRWWDGHAWVGGPVIAGAVPSPVLMMPAPLGPYGYSASGFRAVVQYAGFGQRLGAVLIDGLILGVPSGILFALFFAAAPRETRACTVNGRAAFCEVPTGGSIALFMLGMLTLSVCSIVFYFGFLEGRRGQTVGKRALGIKTVRRTTGEVPGVGRAIGRTFAHYLSGFLCYLGYLWMLWDNEKQTWHDKICDTIVIKV
jgi:uncharacterized RDD family membrane protein YckC